MSQIYVKRHYCNGFTLIEVLITLIVLSIGMLGLASLQVTGLKLGHDSKLRTTATILAHDMADRMRSNPSIMDLGSAGNYDNPNGNLSGNPNCRGKDSSGNDVNVQCNNNQLALHDFYEWYANLRGQAATSWHPAIPAALPAGDGIVCIDSSPNDGAAPPGNPECDGIVSVPNKPIFVIKIWWRERKDESDPGTLQRFVTSLSL